MVEKKRLFIKIQIAKLIFLDEKPNFLILFISFRNHLFSLMDQTEQQEEYHQQNMERNETRENKIKNITNKFDEMDEKLNNLTDLISDLAAQRREGKHKYESKRSDSRGKKKAKLMLEGKKALCHQ